MPMMMVIQKKSKNEKMQLSFLAVSVMLAVCRWHSASAQHDYRDALSKSILFFEGQRSGYLPDNQRLSWRKSSGLQDGFSDSVDLVGGYYDAGDNIKFGFPMAFTATTLAWSIIEFGDSMGDEYWNALTALRWATDYFLKASKPDRLFIQVGDPKADHACWERPEDMNTPRTAYSVDAQNPGSDVAAETAAALAAASIAFRSSDYTYSQTLFAAAEQLFKFADSHRGAYSNSDYLKSAVCPFYCDFDGYQDELLWGASWMHKASGNYSYLDYIQTNGRTLGADDAINEFGWDNKHAGINVLISREFLSSNVMFLQDYKVHADSFVCSLLPETNYPHVSYTPGGLIYKSEGSNMQDVTAMSFLLLVYAKYISEVYQSVYCGEIEVTPARLRAAAKRQVDYILGDNPMGMSYMVGYGNSYPQRIHHRGSSLPSVTDHPAPFGCKDGTYFYNTTSPNPNLLVGAVVGGPDSNDYFADNRVDFRHSEPTTYINSPFVGALAYFCANP